MSEQRGIKHSYSALAWLTTDLLFAGLTGDHQREEQGALSRNGDAEHEPLPARLGGGEEPCAEARGLTAATKHPNIPSHTLQVTSSAFDLFTLIKKRSDSSIMHEFAVLPRLLLDQASGGIFEGELYRRLDATTSDEHGLQTLGISGGLHLSFVRQWPGRMSLMLVGAPVTRQVSAVVSK